MAAALVVLGAWVTLMRLLLVTEDIPVLLSGGAAKHAVLLGNTLIAAGHDVEMLGRVRAPGVEGNSDFMGVMHCRIDLRRTGWQEYRFGAFLPGRREHIGRRIWSAIQELGIERYDVIHYHGHHSAVGACVPNGVNFVQTLHDQGSECIVLTRFKDGAPCGAVDARACASCAIERPNPLQVALSAAAVRRLRATSVTAFSRHKTIFVSHFLERRFREIVKPSVALKSAVVHNFTDAAGLRKACAAAPAGPAITEPVALVVGRIDRAKGMPALLESAPDELLKRLRWRIAGDGPDRPSLEAAHRARGVEFLGFLPQHRVYQETLAAAVCVVPSVCEEACATTILEALALGRPVFALDRGGTPELVRYERYAGQVMLSASMPELVGSLAAFAIGWQPRPAGVDDAGDALRRLPEILAIYGLPAGGSHSPIKPAAMQAAAPDSGHE